MKFEFSLYRAQLRRAMRNIAWIWLLLAVLIMPAAAQNLAMQPGAVSNSAAPPPQLSMAPPIQRLKIALLLPLTGPQSPLGQAMQNAAVMGIYASSDPRLAIVPYDTAGKPEQAQLAATRAVAEGAGVILGPLYSTEVRAIKNNPAMPPIPILSFSNDSAAAGQNVFLLGMTPQTEIATLLHDLEQRGVRIVHVLAPDTPYGNGVLDAAKNHASRSGVKLQTIATYSSSNPKQLLAAVQKIKSALPNGPSNIVNSYHAVLVGEVGGRLGAVDANFQKIGINSSDVIIAGPSSWLEANFANLPSLQQSYYVLPDPKSMQQFAVKYGSYFGGNPPGLAMMAFDGVQILSAAFTGAAQTGSIQAALSSAPSFHASAGLLRFNPQNMAERQLSVIRADSRNF